MELVLVTQDFAKTPVDLLIIPCTEEEASRGGPPVARALDKRLDGILWQHLSATEFKGKDDEEVVLHSHGRLAAAQIALFGIGARKTRDHSVMARLGYRAVKLAERFRCRSVGVVILGWTSAQRSATAAVEAVAKGMILASYRFGRYQSRNIIEPSLQRALLFSSAAPAPVKKALARAAWVANATLATRDLVNEPSGVLTPGEMARRAKGLAEQHGLDIRIDGPAELTKLDMRLMLAVAAGSKREPRLIRLAYQPPRAKKRVVLVGKGVTFDAGGLDIKTATGMADMKTDMAGAASVLGAMHAVALLRPRVQVIGYLACAENMLGEGAYKPGDIIVSRSGLSVEISNTDAEGRLLLADTLSLTAEDEPHVLLDVATLTGACVTALGPYLAGVFTPHDRLAADLQRAGQLEGEGWWRLPLDPALKDQLKSPLADLKNAGGRGGGAISAALFLQEFVPRKTQWAHLDIAGPASCDKPRGTWSKGATGFGVATLTRYLTQLAG